MALIGIVPAAGWATRLGPISCSKEVVEVGGRPVIDHLLERLRAADCDEIRVVTRPGKRDVAEHARAAGAAVIEAHPPTLARSLLVGLEGLEPPDTVVFGFPDSIWEPLDGFRRALELLDSGFAVGLGLFRGPDPSQCGPVVTDTDGRVLRVEVKPERPGSDWIWGCAATRAGVLAGLAGHDEPGAFFDTLSRGGVVGAVRLGDGYVDIGTPAGLAAGGVEHAWSA